jgi:hypothetical protein
MRVPINFTGGSYKHKSLPLSAQVTRNFWPQKQADAKTKSDYVLAPFVGFKEWHNEATYEGADRGMLPHRGALYKVTGNNLLRFDQFGTVTQLGNIPGALRCVLFAAGTSVIVVTGGVAYEWDGSTLNTGNDIDFETPNAGAYLNSRAIYDGDEGRWCCSDTGDPLSINALNYATAESASDDIVRPYVFEQRVYMCGQETIEPWWNSDQGTPPFDRIEQGIMQFGLAGIFAITHNDDFMYLLDDDSQVQAVKGSSAEVVSTPPLTAEIAQYSVKSDCIIWPMTIEGQKLTVYTYPSANKTYIYPQGGEWFEWSSGNEGGRSIANSYAYIFGKHLVADYRNGNIYELDVDTYDELGEPIIRMRDSAPLHSGIVGAPGKNIELNSLEVILEPGIGLNSGQGEDPQLMLRISTNGGKTFGPEITSSMGAMGQYGWVVEFHGLNMSAESYIFRVSISDPVKAVIYSGAVDIEIGI